VELRILNRKLRFFERPGAGGGVVTDLSLGLLGNIRAAQIPTVELDNSHFSLIGGVGVSVPTVAVVSDHLEATPPGSYLGSYAVDASGTEMVRPRVTQVIPTKYAAILIHRDGVAPAITYQELLRILEADGSLESCANALA
jgi:hypothetical protein